MKNPFIRLKLYETLTFLCGKQSRCIECIFYDNEKEKFMCKKEYLNQLSLEELFRKIRRMGEKFHA